MTALRTSLTADEAQRIVQEGKLTATANWYGRTGHRERSAWIDRDGDDWIVWDTDERGDRLYGPSRFASETEALDRFLRMARAHKAADAHAVRRIEGRE